MEGKRTEAGEVPERGMPFEAALTAVVKGLHEDPILLFGIGAGIVVVGALTITSSLPLVLVVAGLFVVVLVARLFQRAGAVSKGADVKVHVFGSSVHRNRLATGQKSGRFRALFAFSSVQDNEIGPGSGRGTRDRAPED